MYENSFYEFVFEVIYEIMYMNTQNMNSYMNSCTNKHNMAIRVFQIWRSGCSRSERRRRLRLWRRGCGESLKQRGGLRRAKAGRSAIRPRRVPGLSGLRRMRLAAASDGGPRQVTTVAARGRWRKAAAGDGGPLRVFLERELCEICAQAAKDLGCCMPLPVREAA